MGPRIRDGLAAVIHEVAHHVVSMRAPKLTVRERQMALLRQRRGRDRFVHHGPVFLGTLRELVGYWYGDPEAYPWETEYRSLRAAGASREKGER